MPNLPLAFGELLAGGLLIHRGIIAARDGFSSSSTTAGLPATPSSSSPSSSSTPAAVNTGARQGAVTMGDLAAIGRGYGWGTDQLTAWWHVITAESGGDPRSVNPSSGAFGIGQFLGSTKTEYAKYGATSTDPMQQLAAMARYIHDRYGSPAAAWAHEQSAHWY